MARELSYKQVTHRLGCSVMQVSRFVKAGRLKPREELGPGTRRRLWFKVDEVVALQKEWKRTRASNKKRTDADIIARNERGPVAAAVFRALAEQKTIQEIVIELEVDPILVRELADEYELSFEDKRALVEKRRLEAEEREAARAHEKRANLEDWKKWKRELLDLEIRAKRQAG